MGGYIQSRQSQSVAPGGSGRNNKQVSRNNTMVFKATMTRANSAEPKNADFFAVGGDALKNGVDKSSNNCLLKTVRITEEDG
jgi:hypothetical protein